MRFHGAGDRYFTQPGVYNLNRFRLYVVGMPAPERDDLEGLLETGALHFLA